MNVIFLMHSGVIHIIYWYDSHSFPIEPSNSPLRRQVILRMVGRTTRAAGTCWDWDLATPGGFANVREQRNGILNRLSVYHAIFYFSFVFMSDLSDCMFGMFKGDCICIRTAVCHFHSPNRLFCCRDPGTLGPWDPGTLGPWDPGTLGYDPRQFGRHWVRRLGEPDVPASGRSSNPDPRRKSRWMSAQDWWFFKVCSGAAPLRNRNTNMNMFFLRAPSKRQGFGTLGWHDWALQWHVTSHVTIYPRQM